MRGTIKSSQHSPDIILRRNYERTHLFHHLILFAKSHMLLHGDPSSWLSLQQFREKDCSSNFKVDKLVIIGNDFVSRLGHMAHGDSVELLREIDDADRERLKHLIFQSTASTLGDDEQNLTLFQTHFSPLDCIRTFLILDSLTVLLSHRMKPTNVETDLLATIKAFDMRATTKNYLHFWAHRQEQKHPHHVSLLTDEVYKTSRLSCHKNISFDQEWQQYNRALHILELEGVRRLHVIKLMSGVVPRIPQEMSWQILVTEEVQDGLLNLEEEFERASEVIMNGT